MLRQPTRPMLRGLLHGDADRVMTRHSPLVETDGPDGVYTPTEAHQWVALGIHAPTHCHPCGDASGSLLPSIGTMVLAPDGVANLYRQTVTGWARPFAGLNTDVTNGRFAQETGRALAAGESGVYLVYAAIETYAATKTTHFLSGWGPGLTGSGPGIRAVGSLADGTQPGLRVNGSATALALTNHGPITVVRPYLVVRDCEVGDATALYTDLEVVTQTHYAGAVASTFGAGFGALLVSVATACPGSLYGLAAWWDGDDAAALINAGLANETLLTRLGWTLSY